MGRKLMRVPLGFNWELGKIWKGYDVDVYDKDDLPNMMRDCNLCKSINKCSESASYCIYYPDNYKKWHYDPPKGEGYQLWETTSEGFPMTPVFKTLDKLCEYATKNCSVFASNYISKEEWKRLLIENKDGKVLYIQGNITWG